MIDPRDVVVMNYHEKDTQQLYYQVAFVALFPLDKLLKTFYPIHRITVHFNRSMHYGSRNMFMKEWIRSPLYIEYTFVKPSIWLLQSNFDEDLIRWYWFDMATSHSLFYYISKRCWSQVDPHEMYPSLTESFLNLIWCLSLLLDSFLAHAFYIVNVPDHIKTLTTRDLYLTNLYLPPLTMSCLWVFIWPW